MLANFLSKSRPVNYLLILFLLLIFFTKSVFNTVDFGLSLISILKSFLGALSLLFLVILSNFITQKNRLTKDNSYALFIFVLFFGMLPTTMIWSYLFLSNIFLMISLRRVYSLKNNSRIVVKIFDAGFWLGISILFYPYNILFFGVIFAGMLSFSKISLKNLLTAFLGTATPIFLFYVYCLVFDQVPLFQQLSDINFSIAISNYHSLTKLIPLTLIFSLLIWSFFSVNYGINKFNKKHKSTWILILLNLFFAILVTFLSNQNKANELIFLFFPSSLIIATYLQNEKDKWFRNMVVYLLLFVTIGLYFL